VAIPQHDENIYKSARNVPKVAVLPVADLNAGDICTHQRMLFTKDALVAFLNREAGSES
jgi:large subunit ribosomal protein L4